MKAVPVSRWLSFGAMALTPLEASSAEPTALSWWRSPGAEVCPAVGEVSARVEQHLKRRAFVAPAEAVQIVEASIARRSSGGFFVSIALVRPGSGAIGTRDLELPQLDCSAAVDAAALTLALMIEPDFAARTARESARTEEQEATVVGPPAPISAPGGHSAIVPSLPALLETQPPAPCPEPPGRLAVRLSAGPWLALGTLPKPGVGVMGGVRLAPTNGRVSAEITGGFLTPRRRLARSDAGADFWASFAGLYGAWTAVPGSRVRLSLGAGMRVAAIEAEAFGFSINHYEEVWQVDLGTQLELELELSEHWLLLLRPNLLVPARRQAFEVRGEDGTNRFFTSAPVQLALSTGLAFAP